MSVHTYWATSVDAGSCNSCGERSMGLKVVVVRIETESGTIEVRFCRHCSEELIKGMKARLKGR